jgi:phage baseplate assembly protein W
MISEKTKMGKDLRLRFDELGADIAISARSDLATVSDEANLAQAIVSRLSTEKGELKDLGHPNYGCRLNEVIGEINNEIIRRKIKAIVHECLSQETRIKEIVRVNVNPDPHDHHKMNIEIIVLPQEGTEYLTIMYPFNLEGL